MIDAITPPSTSPLLFTPPVYIPPAAPHSYSCHYCFGEGRRHAVAVGHAQPGDVAGDRDPTPLLPGACPLPTTVMPRIRVMPVAGSAIHGPGRPGRVPRGSAPRSGPLRPQRLRGAPRPGRTQAVGRFAPGSPSLGGRESPRPPNPPSRGAGAAAAGIVGPPGPLGQTACRSLPGPSLARPGRHRAGRVALTCAIGYVSIPATGNAKNTGFSGDFACPARPIMVHLCIVRVDRRPCNAMARAAAVTARGPGLEL